jgi:hypothetical protein
MREPPKNLVSFPYVGGPLDGLEVRHQVLPEKPEESMLRTATTCAKDEDVDYVAQGMYRMEQQEGRWVAVHVQSDEDQPFHILEPKKQDEDKKDDEEPKQEKPKKDPIRLHPPGPTPKWMINVKRRQDEREKEKQQ